MKNSREIIVDILLKVEKEGTYLQLLLKKELDGFESLDKSFITEVATGAMKRQITIDYIINEVSTIKINKMKPFIRNLLRMSVYQLKYLDKIPAHAVIDEAVKLTKKKGYATLTKFVNAVLRNVDRQDIILPDDDLSVKYSIAPWIIDSWSVTYGPVIAEKIANELSANRAKVSARINTLKTTKTDLINFLVNESVIPLPGNIYPDEYLYLNGVNDIASMKSFAEGLFTIQDESAGIVSHVVNPLAGEYILDLCSAPGGKSTHLAQLSQNQANIISTDIFEHKIDLVKKNASRLGAGSICAELYDEKDIDKFVGRFDKVLIDVPCSGLGLLKRKPDINFNRNEYHIAQINATQKSIAKTAASFLKPGGSLVYSTCTLNKTENELMVDYISALGLVPDCTLIDYVPDMFKEFVSGGHVTIFPFVANTDGFFIAKFKK
ncbi:MAG: 16S rRNA (cytosine(967)-C(5))-methyltransferase [Candidatus Epulonipiscioides saccharophilum]|nr:MAG: 16S rRNA (cytosine(967)-C(5))-methyltransferase [Epulopiscium sp. AS2M-Bin001]